MRLSRLVGLPVVDTHAARQAGVVSDVLIDVRAGRLAVLNVQHSDGWLVQRIPAQYIYRLGPRHVLVADTEGVDMGPPVSGSGWFPANALVGLEVLSDGGDRVGHVADADLDGQTLAVKSYLLTGAGGPWRRTFRVRAEDVVAVSPELMIVRRPVSS